MFKEKVLKVVSKIPKGQSLSLVTKIKKLRDGISKNVFILGLVSFFNDIATEMITPLVPIFLTTVLGAPVSIVGVIEGIAEATASILKGFSGWISDKLQKRKIFVEAGYFLSSLGKFFLSLAHSWPFVLFARFIDRFGKGVRTSTRDALIVESSEISNRGKAFGFHRAADTLGAVFGPLLALLAIKFFDSDFRLIFLLAVWPALIGLLLLILFVKEQKNNQNNVFNLRFNLKDFNPSFKIFLLISIIFALGNSSDAFLILRAKNFGLTLTLTILLYVLFNIMYAFFSMPAGIISDKIGSKKVLIFGFVLFAIIYFLFGIIDNSLFLWVLFPLYGIYMAFTEGVGKAYISNFVPQEKSGTAFGIYQTSMGLCAFLASSIAGLLWTYLGVKMPFIFGSFMALVATILFIVLGEKNKKF